MLSAYGLALADVVEEVQEPCSLQYAHNSFADIDQRVGQLSKRCCETLRARGFSRSVSGELSKHCRVVKNTFFSLYNNNK